MEIESWTATISFSIRLASLNSSFWQPYTVAVSFSSIPRTNHLDRSSLILVLSFFFAQILFSIHDKIGQMAAT